MASWEVCIDSIVGRPGHVVSKLHNLYLKGDSCASLALKECDAHKISINMYYIGVI